MVHYFNQEIDELVQSLNTDEKNGLTTEEAVSRIGRYGHNQLESKSKKSFLRIFLEQFKSFMIIILLIAAAVSGVVGVMEGEGLLDTVVILGILVLNAFVGAYQEKKAEMNELQYENGLIGNMKIIQQPEVSTNPVAPKKKQIVILAGVASLFMFIFLDFFIEYVRNATRVQHNTKDAVVKD